jgi:hypothetical protein
MRKYLRDCGCIYTEIHPCVFQRKNVCGTLSSTGHLSSECKKIGENIYRVKNDYFNAPDLYYKLINSKWSHLRERLADAV